jgi:hypothetical protein
MYQFYNFAPYKPRTVMDAPHQNDAPPRIFMPVLLRQQFKVVGKNAQGSRYKKI